MTNKLTNILFIIYSIILFWIVLFKLGMRFSYMENRSINLVPNNKMNRDAILNVMIFIPLGIYAGILFRRWFFITKVLFFFLVSLMFEALQFILKIGVFDITDIITNTIGGIIGLIVFYIIKILFNNNVNAQKFINALATVATVLIISLLLLLKLNMLPVRYR